MIEFFLSMTPLSWWTLIILFIVYFLVPYIKKLEFNNQTKPATTKLKPIGGDSLDKFNEQEYYSLCLELIESWQWRIKMKLNISFQSHGYDQINQYILEQFNQQDQTWVAQLINTHVSFEEKNNLAKSITIDHYTAVFSTIHTNLK